MKIFSKDKDSMHSDVVSTNVVHTDVVQSDVALQDDMIKKHDHGKTSREKFNRGMIISYTILFLGLLMTAVVWQYVSMQIASLEKQRFESLSENMINMLSTHIEKYSAALRSSQAFFASSDIVKRNEWQEYVDAVNDSGQIPDFRSFGYSEFVNDADKESFIESVRNDTTILPTGYPDFNIKPDGQRNEYLVIKYIEPYQPYMGSFGNDILTDPQRNETARLAIDTGKPTITRTVKAYSGPVNDTIFAIYAPIYLNNKSIDTLEERRAAAVGIVAISFTAKNLQESMLTMPGYMKGDALGITGAALTPEIIDKSYLIGTNLTESYIDFELFDDESLDANHIILDNDDDMSYDNVSLTHKYMSVNRVEVANRVWTVFTASKPGFGLTDFRNNLPSFVLFIGILLSILMFGLTYSIALRNFNAEKLARTITKELTDSTRHLKESDEKYNILLEFSTDQIFMIDTEFRYVSVNNAVASAIMKKPEDIIGKSLTDIYGQTEQSDRFKANIKEVIKSKKGVAVEEKMIIADKDSYISTQLNPVLDSSGKVTHVIGIVRDITDRREVEIQLKKRTAELEKFNKIAVDRELTMVELKKQLAEYKEKTGEKK